MRSSGLGSYTIVCGTGQSGEGGVLMDSFIDITVYHSLLCPRCQIARKHLREITSQDQTIRITEIDILRHPLQTWQDGIRFIPALKIKEKVLSGIYLNKSQISSFIYQSKQ